MHLLAALRSDHSWFRMLSTVTSRRAYSNQVIVTHLAIVAMAQRRTSIVRGGQLNQILDISAVTGSCVNDHNSFR